MEGDPDNPINGGTLCPKGASQMQLAVSPRLRKSPMFREARSSEWREVDWDFAMDWFARRFKDSRDNTFVERDEAGRTVNRCEGIAWVGSATVANEDAYLITKTMRGLGLMYHRPSGPDMTQPHGGQFGRHVRPGRHDQPLEGHQERRCHPGHGRQPGGEPPLRIQVGTRGA